MTFIQAIRIQFFCCLLLIFLFGCKSKQPAPSNSSAAVNDKSNYLQAEGKISLKYKDSCRTMIILNMPSVQDTAWMIPIPPLDKDFDSEGLEVTFGYRRLAIANPKGCNAGVPVQLYNVQRKK